MVGVRNSVGQRFRRDFPGINLIRCPCHEAHLCANYAIRQLSAEQINFARNIYNFFKFPKRRYILKQYQINLNLDLQQVLRPVSTRWLQWDAALVQ